jgi:hypothetical protein
MNYFKGILSGIAAIFLAELVPGSWSVFRGISREKATGLAAVAGGLAESVFSPLFWILVVLFFALLFAASRLGNKLLRVFLFWIPTLTVSAFGIAIVTLFTYLFIRVRHP